MVGDHMGGSGQVANDFGSHDGGYCLSAIESLEDSSSFALTQSATVSIQR